MFKLLNPSADELFSSILQSAIGKKGDKPKVLVLRAWDNLIYPTTKKQQQSSSPGCMQILVVKKPSCLERNYVSTLVWIYFIGSVVWQT